MLLRERFLFSAELDGTLLPNARSRAADGCLQRTQRLLQRLLDSGLPVCFASGRSYPLARRAQRTFRLPTPAYWICNVGTEIYGADGQRDAEWLRRMGDPIDRPALRRALESIPGLEIQEQSRQGPHKFSLLYPRPIPEEIGEEILHRMRSQTRPLSLIASLGESTGQTLLDIIPEAAGKMAALLYLAERHDIKPADVYYVGGSEFDLSTLPRGVRGTLVGDAAVRARRRAGGLNATAQGVMLYLATATYGDGVIEGLKAHNLLQGNAAV